MITIDPLDDEVVKKPRQERSRSDRSRRSARISDRAEEHTEKKSRASLLRIALRLLRGSIGEEE